MAIHNALGKAGEDAVAAYLEHNGYVIRDRNWRKIRRIVIAADAYVKHFRIDAPVRFDIITAVGDAGAFEIEHIKEAFYPPVF